MFSVSQDVAYLSSVVMFMTVPAEMGMSASPVVLPVRISGPLVSRAMATWRPFWTFSASRALSITVSAPHRCQYQNHTKLEVSSSR